MQMRLKLEPCMVLVSASFPVTRAGTRVQHVLWISVLPIYVMVPPTTDVMRNDESFRRSWLGDEALLTAALSSVLDDEPAEEDADGVVISTQCFSLHTR